MKRYLHAFAMCQSMFCAIPCPWMIWDEDAKDSMLLFLPVIGLEIGILWALLAWIMQLLQIPALMAAIVLCAYPYLVTGFMHLDGFMDVTDAVKSWRDLERRREILKDSHVGSFAVINCILLLLAQFACFAANSETTIWIFTLIPIVSRCGSAIAITCLKPMSTSQYANQTSGKSKLIILILILCITLICGFLFFDKCGIVLLVCVLGYSLALRRGYKSLEGMNGDIAGYALCIGECCAIAAYALI